MIPSRRLLQATFQYVLISSFTLACCWTLSAWAETDGYIELEGKVHYALKREVTNAYPGRIKSINVAPNESVSKGQTLGLYTLDEYGWSVLNSRISSSAINDITIEIEKVKKEIASLNRDIEAHQILLAEGMTSPLTVRTKQDALTLHQDKLKHLEKKLLLKKRNQKREKAHLSKTLGGIAVKQNVPNVARLVAPISGKVLWIVDQKNWELQKNAVCFKIADTNDTVIRAQVYLEDYPMLKKGMDATITSDNFPGKNYRATLIKLPLTPINKSYSALSYYEIVLKIHDAGDTFREGNSVKVTIPLDGSSAQ